MHPLSKHTTRYNECVDYAAKMTIVLTYFKCEDDWLDERKISKQAYKRLLRKAYQEIKEEYPDKLAHIETCLHCINDYESQGITNLDEISKYFGEVMGEICDYKDDEWHDELYEFVFYLGKFILELMISEATMAFERLPIIENAAIIRNILYGGVWNKYELVRQKRLEGRK